MKKTKVKRKKKKKAGIHHRIHQHVKKHLQKLKKKRPHVHKVVVLMSITLPIMLGALFFGSSALYVYENFFDNANYNNNEKEKITVNLPAVEDDTLNWKTYQDDLSGFSTKYPDRWTDPVISQPENSEGYVRKISFDNGVDLSNDLYKGFQVFVYDAKKHPGPVGTDNLLAANQLIFTKNGCDKAEFGEAALGEENFPAQEVDVPAGDQCFQETYFFSVTKGNYTFNILPMVGQKSNPIIKKTKSEIIAAFPKFFEILSTITLVQEKKNIEDKTVTNRPAIQKNAPPHRALIHLGKCAHKNDHPRKSRTKKHRHMDEDCCMDPDEWPNPRCQY